MLTLSLAFLVAPSFAADVGPKPYEPEIALLVGSMLAEAHYEDLPADDSLSQAWFDGWLDMLDYQRLFFLQSDVDRFRAERDELDDRLRSDPPDLSLATEMFELSRKRFASRVDVALSHLDGSLDLTDDESWVYNRHDAGMDWPETTEELDELWRKRVEGDLISALLVECGTDTPTCFTDKRGEVEERLRKRYERQLKNYDDYESTDVLEMYLGALAGVYDPHSVWFAPARNDNFDIDITNSVEGIGARLRVKEGYTTVEDVIVGGPAAEEGSLQKGDKIVAVAQGDEDPVDVVDWRIDKVVKLIRGPKGSEVRLLVRPGDANDPSLIEEIRITRDRVKLEESAASMDIREVDGKKLAIIDVPSFYVPAERGANGVADDVNDLLRKAKREGAEGVLLDLSMNGGGSLQQAVDMAGLFITAGPVVQIRDRDGRVAPLHDRDTRQVWDGPLVVLTTQASASASEIVAGALQDYGRALVVGAEQTHGKGTVQQVADITRMMQTNPGRDPVGGALKLTVQKFYRVSGASTQLKGVVPDVVLPSPFDGLEVLEGDLDHALAWDEIPPIPHASAGGFGDVVDELRKRSKERVSADEAFQELAEELRDREAHKDDLEVSLNLEERRKELAEARAEEEAEPEEAEETEEGSRTPAPILDEGVRVLADLVTLQQS